MLVYCILSCIASLSLRNRYTIVICVAGKFMTHSWMVSSDEIRQNVGFVNNLPLTVNSPWVSSRNGRPLHHNGQCHKALRFSNSPELLWLSELFELFRAFSSFGPFNGQRIQSIVDIWNVIGCIDCVSSFSLAGISTIFTLFPSLPLSLAFTQHPVLLFGALIGCLHLIRCFFIQIFINFHVFFSVLFEFPENFILCFKASMISDRERNNPCRKQLITDYSPLVIIIPLHLLHPVG